MTAGPAERRMTEYLDRLEAWNGHVNAIVAQRPAEDLLEEARAADRAGATGPLHGQPVAVKDLVRTRGIVTTWGSPLYAGHVPDRDDVLAARLRAAGAILTGKTNVPEFGLGSHSFNPVYGVTRNPFDTARTAGGSSGGAGAALATGMLEIADGSDMMGSLRNPAGWNNVYSLRPGWGLVPGDPDGEVYWHTLSTPGPMARTPRALAGLMDVMAGPHPGQPLSRAAAPLLPALEGATLEGLRIGFLGDWGGAYPMEDGILDLVQDALALMGRAGAQVRTLAPPFPAERIWRAWCDLRSLSVAGGQRAHYAAPETRARLKPEAIWEIERGRALTGAELSDASAARSDWFRAAQALFETHDALVLPTAQVWPFPADWRYPERIGSTTMDTYHRWMDVVTPVSLLGLPAVTLPAGFSGQGLPMGMQFFGRMGSDAVLLRIAEAWHRVAGFPGVAPELPRA